MPMQTPLDPLVAGLPVAEPRPAHRAARLSAAAGDAAGRAGGGGGGLERRAGQAWLPPAQGCQGKSPKQLNR